MHQDSSSVVGLVGGTGGVGASTLACAVAALAAEVGLSTLLVDLSPHGGGLDTVVGAAHLPGRRWPSREEDLQRLRCSELPTVDGLRVLSHSRRVAPSRTLGGAAVEGVARLARAHDVVVLDLPRPDHPRALAWWHLASCPVLVVSTSPPQVAGALAVRALLPTARATVARTSSGCGLHPGDVSDLLGLPLLARLDHDPSVATALLEEVAPGRAEGAVRDAAVAVLALATGARRGLTSGRRADNGTGDEGRGGEVA
ncbi:cellulose synthase operon protein YhjQ/BcsQ [Ornithinimicrobium sp. LYQ121]|uniref:cellulose synthase operon protein YhjQ/BcsQ n=1 Tax=Ornithinimicrobium sp. LYQ121 TaxID=3378801 RepID=UPI003853D7E3